MRTLSASLLASALALACLPAQRPPDIVVLLADDAGYADFSCQGALDLRTPRIDSIAARGVRCTDGYVSGCVCSPSRAGLLTGRHQQRFGHETNIAPRYSETDGLPVEERTLADLLGAAGHRTIALGKWHLGYAPAFHPLARGFTDYWGFLQGARSYFPLAEPTRLNRLLHDRDPAPERFDYLTDALARRAAEYVGECAAAAERPPFLLYVAFNAVHTPMEATTADLAAVPADGVTSRRRKLIAMTHALDRAVGTVLDALNEHGLGESTLVVFLNDNGGATNNASRNTPLRGRKGQMFEGGIRVPFLVQWPARLPAGRVVEVPVTALDLLPTFLAAAGIDLPTGGERPLDGQDLLPLLAGDDGAEEPFAERTLHWRHLPAWAVRCGRWKLVCQADGDEDEPPLRLFDLVADASETDDLAAKEPERVAALRALHEAWAAELAAPRWGY
ncbi:MAG: sulfatase-like hydrolase/transferase [Planctomycetota bacterium]